MLLQRKKLECKVIGDEIVYGSDMIAVIKIEPIDIYLLGAEEQVTFYRKLNALLNSLGMKIQVTVCNEPSKINDLSDHLKSLHFDSFDDKRKLAFLELYAEALENTVAVHSHKILKKSFYIQISIPCPKSSDMPVARKRLDGSCEKISRIFLAASIKSKRVSSADLIEYLRKYDL